VETGRRIKIEQNKPIQIERLRAQRRLYDEARKKKNRRICGAYASTIVITLISHLNFNNPALIWIAPFSILLFEKLYHYFRERKLQHIAAHIQELFDTDVLCLEWPQYEIKARPTAEMVRFWADKYDEEAYQGKPPENWYEGNFESIPLPWARLVCQKANLSYDENLRRAYQNIIIKYTVPTGVFFAAFAYFMPPQTLPWFSAFLASVSPFFLIAGKEWWDNQKAIDAIKAIKANIDNNWSDFLEKEVETTELKKAARNWQTNILGHRKSSPLAPSSLFKKLREVEEGVMSRSTDALAQDVQHALEKRALRNKQASF